MSAPATLLRLVAALSAVLLALALFREPLLTRLPAPLAGVLEALPGEPANLGFLVQVISEPPGAEVHIDGISRGTTPFFGNVVCREKSEVTIEVLAQGWQPWRRVVPCRRGDTLRAEARLER